MKAAVINEVSASARNADIIAALEGQTGIEVFNVGMSGPGQQPQLTYLQTGLMAGALLNSGACDFVVGGCGTGQGFLNAAMQFPGVSCGLILSPLDAWLFSQINAGNCVSLALNKGYGWAAELDLKYIFRELFRDAPGGGYPQSRSESQAGSRRMLAEMSRSAHLPMEEILARLPKELLEPAARWEPFTQLLATTERGGEYLKIILGARA